MSRLTEKANIDYKTNATIHTVGFVVTGDMNKDYNNALKKLYELENLEEEIGCPLEVVFKALKDGVYYEDIANRMKYMVVDLHYNLFEDLVLYFDDEESLLASNYKKTWWLKKDKSE